VTTLVYSTVSSTAVPLRNTITYKTLAETVINALDDSSTAKPATFEEKEAARGEGARRQIRLVEAGKEGHVKVRILANCVYAVFVFLNPLPPWWRTSHL
jgi:import inner membrane translocase subunit TIM44